MDECAEDIHSCVADVEQCRNTEGAYECDVKCGKGFTYNKKIGLGVCVGEFSAFISKIFRSLIVMMHIIMAWPSLLDK